MTNEDAADVYVAGKPSWLPAVACSGPQADANRTKRNESAAVSQVRRVFMAAASDDAAKRP